jgi:hypothetical protein
MPAGRPLVGATRPPVRARTSTDCARRSPACAGKSLERALRRPTPRTNSSIARDVSPNPPAHRARARAEGPTECARCLDALLWALRFATGETRTAVPSAASIQHVRLA